MALVEKFTTQLFYAVILSQPTGQLHQCRVRDRASNRVRVRDRVRVRNRVRDRDRLSVKQFGGANSLNPNP